MVTYSSNSGEVLQMWLKENVLSDAHDLCKLFIRMLIGSNDDDFTNLFKWHHIN